MNSNGPYGSPDGIYSSRNKSSQLPPKIYSDFGDFLDYFTVNTDSHTPAFNPQSLNGCSMAGFIWYHP